MVPGKRDSKAVRTLIFILILSLIGNGLQVAINSQVKDNNDVYTKTLKHSFEQREAGYRIRLETLAKSANTERLRADSLLVSHRDHLRQDSILISDLKKVKGKFSDLTAEQVRNKMIEEYNKSK